GDGARRTGLLGRPGVPSPQLRAGLSRRSIRASHRRVPQPSTAGTRGHRRDLRFAFFEEQRMSDTANDTAAAAPTGARTMPITVIAQYLKDLSFENPNAPEVLAATGDGAPQG